MNKITVHNGAQYYHHFQFTLVSIRQIKNTVLYMQYFAKSNVATYIVNVRIFLLLINKGDSWLNVYTLTKMILKSTKNGVCL